MLINVRRYWEDNYSKARAQTQTTEMIDPSPLARQFGATRTSNDDLFTAYTQHYALPINARKDTNVIAWWATAGDSELRSMAYDLLSIPAISTHPSFSLSPKQ